MANKIDLAVTNRNTIKYLSDIKKPIGYKELFNHCAVFCPVETYGDKTDPVEKYRQYYSEQNHADIIFITGGFIALRRWFPDKSQLRLIPPQPYSEILRGNCLLSYDTGYEQALRQQHMVDHFGDANTKRRSERRRRGAMVESHIKHYFSSLYPNFYKPASNEGKYSQPATDDFSLHFLNYYMSVDVKTWTNNDDDKMGYIRNIKPRVIYLWGDWLDDDTVQIDGFESGEWLAQFNIPSNGLTSVKNRLLLDFDILLVILNMAKDGIDYPTVKKEFASIKE